MSDSVSSSALSRWALPLAIVWAELLLSAYAFERQLPDSVKTAPSRLLLGVLFALPVLSALALFGMRWLDRRLEHRSPAGNAFATWILAFGFTTHALVLAVATGGLSSLHPGLAVAVGGLLLGLSALLPTLPVGHPYGIVHQGTRSSPTLWRRVHRGVAVGFALSGVLAMLTAALPSGLGLVFALLPAAALLGWGMTRAGPRAWDGAPRGVSDEDGEASLRLSKKAEGPSP